MAHAKITLGVSKTSAKKFEKELIEKALKNNRRALKQGLEKSGRRVERQMKAMLSGTLDDAIVNASRPYSRARVFGGEGAQDGTEIVLTSGMDAIISTQSGRMKNAIESGVSVIAGAGRPMRLTVGFPFYIPAANLSKVSPVIATTKIDRRRKAVPRKSRSADRGLKAQVQDVILGTDKMVGRNIFRLFALRHVETGELRKHVVKDIKEAIRKRKK